MKNKYLVIILTLFTIFVVNNAFISTAQANFSFVNGTSTSNNAAATSLPIISSVTSGNVLNAVCRHGTTFVPPTNVTDTIGNTFIQYSNASNTNAGAITAYYALSTGTNAADTISCNYASSVGGRGISVTQFSGLSTTNPLDATSASATTTSKTFWSTSLFSTAQPNEVLIAAGNAAVSGMGAGAAYNLVATSSAGAGPYQVGTEYQAVSSIQSNVSSSMTATANTGWMMVGGTFIIATSSADVTVSSGVIISGGVTIQ